MIILPILFAFGMLSNLFVTILYSFEKWNQYVLGGSLSGSDIRNILQPIISTGVILIIYGATKDLKDS
jgi:hypothetical protein